MVVVNATKLMVAFYDDHPYTIANFVETFFEGDKPHHPFSRERAIFEGMVLVFPAFKPLFLPLHTVHSSEGVHPVSFDRARYNSFSQWRELAKEDPATTLVAMDLMQDIQVGPIVWEWKEKRFFTILWQYRLEIEAGKFARSGEESSARYELVSYTLYEPGWKNYHQGYARFDAGTLKPIDVVVVPVELTQQRISAAP